MDRWKFFDITHREHVYCNPMSEYKFEELIALLRLPSDARVLDIACGKGEFLTRLAERYGMEGTGVDLSPPFVACARRKLEQRIPAGRLRFLEMDGADYVPEAAESFDLVACIGASWIFGGHGETLAALKKMAAPGAWIIAGEPFWKKEPPAEYLEAIAHKRSTYGSHYENMQAGQAVGLQLVYTLVSHQDDWDRYEGMQWLAAHDWARAHPEDPDVAEVLQRIHENRENYLRWGRDVFGWAIYVFRK